MSTILSDHALLSRRKPYLSPSIDPRSGFCSETNVYHSLRPRPPLPPETVPLSITDYVFALVRQNTPSPETPIELIDAVTHKRIPYPQLVSRTKSLAASLQHQFHLSRGDIAFILSPNSIHLPILYLSLLSLGVIMSPSNPASSQSEISSQVKLCKPVIAFATSAAAHKVPSLSHPTILLDSPEFESMMTNPSRELAGPCVFQSDTAVILYSSGTTGRFKGVELTHRNFISLIGGLQATRPLRASPAVAFCAVPFFHIYGFLYAVRAVAMGDSLVFMGKFDLRAMIRAIEDLKVTHLALAPPTIVNMVNGSDLIGGHDLSSLEVVASGGAPLPTTVMEMFMKKFPGVQLVQAYGLTESTGGVARMVGADETKRMGSSGRLMPYCEAKVVDIDTGARLPPLKRGELWVRSPSIMKGYVDDKEATTGVVDCEGWLRTGDICYFDTEGFLYVVDRLKELIKYKGYQVAPVELENILQTHPDVVDAAVVPYPDEEAGQVPMAFIETRSGSRNITESQIKDFVARQVAPYKKIRRLWFVNSIPKNAAGKVLRRELIKLAGAALTTTLTPKL